MELNELNKLCLETIRQFSADTVYFKDLNSNFLWNSKKHAEQVNAESPESMAGKNDFDYFPEEFAQKALADEREIISTGLPKINIPETLESDDGSEPRYFLASKYPFYDEKHNIIGTWGITRDVTTEKRLEKELELSNKKLQSLARVDDLSGLYNRRYFYETLERMVSIYTGRSGDDSFALVAFDADDLEMINETYGATVGDDALRMIASCIVSNTTKADTCFRTGGDEFMMLLPDCDLKRAIGIANKIVSDTASTPIPMGDRMKKITISSGIAMFTKDMDVAELISTAERKLKKSKRNGKNQSSF